MRLMKFGIIWLGLVLPATARAQTPGTAAPLGVVVRGVVFDSLTMAPVANASVWLPGGTQTANTDDKGRFELDNVPQGKRFLAFSSAALDSLGLGMLGGYVDAAGNGQPVELATPSFRTVWTSLCGRASVASTADSGIVWGTIRDANSDTRLSGAAAVFSWYDFQLGANKRYNYNERQHETRTDSTGNYYECGVPSDIKISTEARGAKSASGIVEYLIGPRRLIRMDLLVSTDMVLQTSPMAAGDADSIAAMRASGTSVLRGQVRDRKGKPVVGAVVTLASIDSIARTNAKGEFVITQLPAGSQALQARQIGYAPATALADLRPGTTTNIVIEMPDARELPTVNVRADRVAGVDREAFEYRQKTGFGFTLMAKDFENRPDVVGVVLTLPRTVRMGSAGRWTFGIQFRGAVCTPFIYLDKVRVEADQITMYPPAYFRAVELYPGRLTTPMGYEVNDCGVVLFWSKQNPRW